MGTPNPKPVTKASVLCAFHSSTVFCKSVQFVVLVLFVGIFLVLFVGVFSVFMIVNPGTNAVLFSIKKRFSILKNSAERLLQQLRLFIPSEQQKIPPEHR